MSALDVALIRALRSATVHLSGSELQTLVGADRETVQARLGELRSAGFQIEDRPGFGYRLLASPDRLMADDLKARLGESPFVRELIVFEETDSTNERAAHLGRSGASGGVAVFAECQTAGRGRFGRRWESAAHLGLWFSLLLRPAFPLPLWPRMTTWAAVAVARTCETEAGVRAGIKWPNDVLLAGRKVAGILIETGGDQVGENFAVVGIGVNLNHAVGDFPEELQATATSLRIRSGHAVPRPAFAAALLAEMEALWPLVTDDFPQLLAEATHRSVLVGELVRVQTGGAVVEGIAEALDTEGQLLVRTGDGTLRQINAGEATLRARME